MADTTPGRSRSGETTTADSAIHIDDTGASDAARRVGVLTTHNSKETKSILNAIRALGHEPVWIRDENVSSRIEDSSVSVSPAVDALVNRLLVTKSDQPLEDLQLAAIFEETTAVVNPPDAVRGALHKYRAGVELAQAGLPVPDAYFGRSPRTFDDWSDHLSATAAHKRTIGTNGRGMRVVSAEDAVNPTIRNGQSFVQEYLETPRERPHDVRVYVVGDRIVGAMRRRAPEDEWRTNVALGGDVTDVSDELGERPRQIAMDATDVLGLDVAGVDLMPVGEEWYLLEVNATAGFKGLYDATGVSAAPYIARLAIERAGGAVSESGLRDLTSTLDDTVPDCKPPLDESDDGDAVLGYTTRVSVSGAADAESTVAKADTGAGRTSIDTALAGRIGAGPMVGTTDVRSAGPVETETRPLVDVDLRVNGHWQTVTASVTDRSNMTHTVLLGRDVLEDYTLDISRRIEE